MLKEMWRFNKIKNPNPKGEKNFMGVMFYYKAPLELSADLGARHT